MSRLPSWSYVNWYYELTGYWATWEPGKRVEPGAVGSFDGQLRFNAYRTLADYGIVPRIAIANSPGSTLARSNSERHFDFKASGESSPGFAVGGNLDADVKVAANHEYAFILHMRDRSEAWIKNIEEVQVQVKALLLKRKWDVDSVVVVRRTEARQGFAAVSLGSGKSFEAKIDADARVMGVADLASAGLVLAPGASHGDFLVFDFGPGSTPVFSQVIRVKKNLWDRLLPWRHSGGTLIAPDGRTYRELPDNLSDHALEARRYDPGRSSMSPGELSAIAVADLFEDVVDLPVEENARQSADGAIAGNSGGRLLSFPLPVPPVPAALAAADPAGSVSPVGETDSPDGLARFTLLDQGGGEYWLEVSVAASVQSPLIVRLRYTTTGQQRTELLVPVISPSASVVALPGYDGGAWRGWSRVPLASVWSGSPEMVQASVRAAVTQATVRAWHRVASAAPEYGRELITQAINAPGAESR
jgi:hypothetical protein